MQKLQTVPQGRTVEAQWSKVLSDTDSQRGHNFWRSIPHLGYLLPVAAGLLILVLLTHPEAAWMVGLAIHDRRIASALSWKNDSSGCAS